jgi:hypothetical protein
MWPEQLLEGGHFAREPGADQRRLFRGSAFGFAHRQPFLDTHHWLPRSDRVQWVRCTEGAKRLPFCGWMARESASGIFVLLPGAGRTPSLLVMCLDTAQ